MICFTLYLNLYYDKQFKIYYELMFYKIFSIIKLNNFLLIEIKIITLSNYLILNFN